MLQARVQCGPWPPCGPAWKPFGQHTPGQPCRLAPAQTHREPGRPLWSGCGPAHSEEAVLCGRFLVGAQHFSGGTWCVSPCALGEDNRESASKLGTLTAPLSPSSLPPRGWARGFSALQSAMFGATPWWSVYIIASCQTRLNDCLRGQFAW